MGGGLALKTHMLWMQWFDSSRGLLSHVIPLLSLPLFPSLLDCPLLNKYTCKLAKSYKLVRQVPNTNPNAIFDLHRNLILAACIFDLILSVTIKACDHSSLVSSEFMSTISRWSVTHWVLVLPGRKGNRRLATKLHDIDWSKWLQPYFTRWNMTSLAIFMTVYSKSLCQVVGIGCIPASTDPSQREGSVVL